MRAQRCKGSRDLGPEDMERFRHIEDVFRSSCLSWGFREIRTPTLEYLHLFTSTGTLTPEMLSRTYSFLDWDGWSGERVVLRPDGTIPAARLYIESLSDLRPAKLFYVENVFSFEDTGQQSRERWQCSAEIMGSAEPLADVELMALCLEILEKLGLREVKLHLSHAGMIKTLLSGVGLDPSEQGEVFGGLLDGDTGALTRVVEKRPELKDPLSMLLEVKGRGPGFLHNLKSTLGKTFPNPGLEACLDDFLTVAESLSDIGCPYAIDIASARSFEYYTGVIFRCYYQDQKVAGGGRYGDLIPLLGGEEVSASGFALRVDSLMDLVRGQQTKDTRVLVRKGTGDPGVDRSRFEMAGLLRRAGYVAEVDQGHGACGTHEWTVIVGGTAETPEFLLMDRSGTRTATAASPPEIISALQAADVPEASSP